MKNLIILSVLMLASTTVLGEEIVTTANFVRAESDMQMQAYTDNYDSFGKFHHNRAMYDVTKQLTIRPNTDTLYSFGVFDLSESLELTMPKTDRYQSAMVVSQDHSIFAVYHGDYILTQKDVGSRYVFVILRTFVDPNDKNDLEKAHAAQDM